VKLLKARIIRVSSLSIVLLYIIIYSFWIGTGTGMTDRLGNTIGKDFILFYATSHEILCGNYVGIYDIATLHAV